MLGNEQIGKILENNLADVGKITGLIGGAIGGGIAGAFGGYSGGDTGTRMGSRSIPIDHKSEVIKIEDGNDAARLIKMYFGESLLYENHENTTYYMVGVKGSGFFNLNPCVLEIIIRGDRVEILAYAKEGVIKQNTCVKAINKFKTYLFGH